MNFAILGCGNMSQALMKGLANHIKKFNYFTYTPSITRADTLAQEIGGESVKTISELPSCDVYLIACKPQQFDELVKELRAHINEKALVISILAGTTTKEITHKLGTSKVLRIMPNTPSLVGHGVNAFYFSEQVGKNEKDLWKKYFLEFSQVFVYECEDKIDLITPFSGSGPAYFFEIARILSEKMVSLGIEKSMAKDMVIHTMLGSAKLMLESNDELDELRNKVTSKKGVTYEALEVFKNSNLEGLFSHAIDKAYNRSVELGKYIED